MLRRVFNAIFASRNQKQLNQYYARANKIEDFGKNLVNESDEQLQDRFQRMGNEVRGGAKLDDQLIEAFAVTREASKRVLGLRHFDVQLVGGMALHDGKISEMKTGEGKTLCATLPASLNALSGKGVHVVTVNDYLATRDSKWMGELYTYLGLSVSALVGNMEDEERKKAYNSDILYAVNNELGFDYLRDNMKFNEETLVQRSLNYAIIDEVDSILIDEARTPLIISGQTSEPSNLYIIINKMVPSFTAQSSESDSESGDYYIDEKSRKIYLSELGHRKAEELFHQNKLIPVGENLYFQQHLHLLHHLEIALQAHTLFEKDKDYVVNNQKVTLVDEFTGRLMQGRRLSHGLHQAIEAKEHVIILPNSQTLASITFQNFFRIYNKLSGMTGTADTEAQELLEIYNLEVLIVPTNQEMIRKDTPDLVYIDQTSKYEAIVEDVIEKQTRGQPVLVGTANIEVSELLSKKFNEKNITHEVLNAKRHAQEARIIAQAGRIGVVTIATNMAGRGTDIILGGNPEYAEHQSENTDDWDTLHQKVIDLGGLHIVGSERHESRRVDNQLRGRSGRQGDPGSSKFYLSLEDSLLRIFASDNVTKMMEWMGFTPGQAIEHKMLTRTIESAQRKVESHNFQLRKNLLEYDTIANDQRKIIYQQRREIIRSQQVEIMILNMAESIVDQLIKGYTPDNQSIADWNVLALQDQLQRTYFLDVDIQQELIKSQSFPIRDHLLKQFNAEIEKKKILVGEEQFQQLIKQIMLAILDKNYKDHIVNLEELLRGIHLRGYAAKNPKQEYKREAFDYFVTLLDNTKSEIVSAIMQPVIRETENTEPEIDDLQLQHQEVNSLISEPTEKPVKSKEKVATITNKDKIKRNDPCPCGSGLKYKKCHGKT